MTDKPAILGGKPIRDKPLPVYNTIGDEEKKAVMEVLDSGVLSGFVACADPEFYGGPTVQALEEEWAKYFGVKHAISCNSATSGLHMAVVAAGVKPGDEVILSPFTMVACGAAILMANAIPVFADITPNTLSLDPASVEKAITPRTKAMIIVHITGHPSDMNELKNIAKKHDIVTIEDNAQGGWATYDGKYTGTIGHMGVFSLNCHKTIQSGEGGIVCTDDDEMAFRLSLVRNHGEKCVKGFGREELNILGLNLRMTEMEAAVARCQLKKLEKLTKVRIELANYLDERVKKELPFLIPPYVSPRVRHAYYVYLMKYDQVKAEMPMDLFAEAVMAEGFDDFIAHWPLPVYYMPLYQKEQLSAYYDTGCPYNCSLYKGNIKKYDPEDYPVMEKVIESSLSTTICRDGITTDDIDTFVEAMKKVYLFRKEILAAKQK